jgi:hypothetical protein
MDVFGWEILIEVTNNKRLLHDILSWVDFTKFLTSLYRSTLFGIFFKPDSKQNYLQVEQRHLSFEMATIDECIEFALMKVRNQLTLRRMKIYYYWTNIRKWNYFNIPFVCGFSTKKNVKSKHNFESGNFQTFCYFILM